MTEREDTTREPRMAEAANLKLDTIEAHVVALLEESSAAEPVHTFGKLREHILPHGASNADDRTLELIRDIIADLVGAIVMNDAAAFKRVPALRNFLDGLTTESAVLVDAVDVVRGHMKLKGRFSPEENAASLIGALEYRDPAFGTLQRAEVAKLLAESRLRPTRNGRHQTGPTGLLAKLCKLSGAFDSASKKKIQDAMTEAKKAKKAVKSRKGRVRPDPSSK